MVTQCIPLSPIECVSSVVSLRHSLVVSHTSHFPASLRHRPHLLISHSSHTTILHCLTVTTPSISTIENPDEFETEWSKPYRPLDCPLSASHVVHHFSGSMFWHCRDRASKTYFSTNLSLSAAVTPRTICAGHLLPPRSSNAF